jgi:hypothetical protein
MKRVINLLILSVVLVLNANAQDCDVPKKETQKFFDSASANIRKKYYITASSYFKAADDIRNQHPNCELYNDEMASMAASIASAATYQTLIEQVISLQDQELYQDAYNKYMIAGTYFQKFQVSEHGLSHDSIVTFIFNRCKGGFASWLSSSYFNQKKYSKTFEIYVTLLEKGFDPAKLKRSLYDLGVEMAMQDKLKSPTDSPKGNAERYTHGDEKLKVFKQGYLYGWGR